MKKRPACISAIMLASIVCVMASCSKGDDANSVTGGVDGPIVGNWTDHKQVTVMTTPSDPTFRQSYDTTYPAGAGPYMEFHRDGTYTGTLNFAAGLIARGTFAVNGPQLITTTTWTVTTHTTETYNFSCNADTLVLWHTYGDTNIVYTQYDTMLRH